MKMLNRERWIRYAASKKPLSVTGSAASSTDSSTWATYREANESNAGVGIGYVLGDGIGCIDLDHCLIDGEPNESAAKFIAGYPESYIEVSPSGDGLHIWGTAQEGPGTRGIEDGLNVERYTVGRYITITKTVFQHGILAPM